MKEFSFIYTNCYEVTYFLIHWDKKWIPIITRLLLLLLLWWMWSCCCCSPPKLLLLLGLLLSTAVIPDGGGWWCFSSAEEFGMTSASPLTCNVRAVARTDGSCSLETLTSPLYMNRNRVSISRCFTSRRITIGCWHGFAYFFLNIKDVRLE